MSMRILRLAVATELDVVAARQRARDIAVECGFALQDQVRIATTVSELARNVYNYAHRGRVEFSIEEDGGRQALQVAVEDQGPGIGNLAEILEGRYTSATGMGLGILGARRLMDHFSIETSPATGTRIIIRKLLPQLKDRITATTIGAMSKRLAMRTPDSMLAEVQQQNQELLSTLAELEESNRSIQALYAELDEKASHLNHANAMKSRFLSNMSHEFRTPLSSIRALSKLLLSRIDGDLAIEQAKQISFILDGANELGAMVDDLLDLAKIEAGKEEVHAVSFNMASLFGELRGTLRPLLRNPRLSLHFQPPAPDFTLHSDHGKITQILRNFISNAIKFTEAGEIIVRAEQRGDGMVDLSVSDTGVGIDARNVGLIFEEFSQVENHLQVGVKGTGLGLPLCRKLAVLLRGSVTVKSTPGAGSCFTVSIPIVHIPGEPELHIPLKR